MSSIDLLKEARQLIRFNTVTTRSNADCALYAGKLLHSLGFRVQYQEHRDAGQVFLNVLAMWGDGSAAPLLLASHLDTVEAGDPRLWTKTGGDPWRAVVRGDSLYGLGAADDKCDFLCKVIAAASVTPRTLARPVMLLGTFGEERGLLGAARFCQSSLPKPAMALVGEPSNLELVTRHKGLLVGELALFRRGICQTETAQMAYELEADGVAAHSSTPAFGQNAIEKMLDVLGLLGSAAGGVKVLSLEGGTAANVVPQRCAALVMLASPTRQALSVGKAVEVRPRRLAVGWHPTLPWMDVVTYLGRLKAVLAAYGRARDRAFSPPALTSTVTRIGTVDGALTLIFDVRALPAQEVDRIAARCEQLAWDLFGPPGDRWQFRRERQNPALAMSSTAPVVQLMRRAMRAARVPARIAAKSGCSEAGWYQMVGIPAVVFGPGQAYGNIHQPNERISLRQLRRAIAVYRAAIERACVEG